MIEIGMEIDGFRVVERLHAGGMATLFRVETVAEADFPIILKIPRLAPGDDSVSVVSHEVERLMMGALTGPHVPRLVAAGDMARQPYVAMEMIVGPSLSAWLDKLPLPAAEIGHLMAAVASAVHAVHLQQFAHLDLKPANVVFRNNGEAVLIDLGLGHHAHFPDLLAEEFRRPVGSAPYMAPEQVAGLRCDPRSDIFALGVILYQLATGELPFGSPTSIGGLRERLYQDPVPPRARVPAVPEWLQEVILRCLEVDAERRYGSAAQLAFDLTHGDQVVVGERGRRLRRQGVRDRFKRWVRAAGWEPSPCPSPSARIAGAPIILVAVATRHNLPAQTEALQDAVRRMAIASPASRMALVAVIPVPPLFGSSDPSDSGGNAHVRELVHLKHWALQLGLPEERRTCHVLESDDIASAILDYARINRVDQIVVGAPPMVGGPQQGVAYAPHPGAVAPRIALGAECSVTLVRPRHDG